MKIQPGKTAKWTDLTGFWEELRDRLPVQEGCPV